MTILLEPRAMISREVDDPNIVGGHDVSEVQRSIRAHKEAYRDMLKSARPNRVIQWGWIEFAEHVLAEKRDASNFVHQICNAEGIVLEDVVSETGVTLVMHLHLLLNIQKNGRSLSAEEIRRLLCQAYPHSNQVKIMSLRMNQSKEEALEKVTGYCHKHAIKLPPVSTADLGLLIAEDRHALRFPIRWGLRNTATPDLHNARQDATRSNQCTTHLEVDVASTPNPAFTTNAMERRSPYIAYSHCQNRSWLWKEAEPSRHVGRSGIHDYREIHLFDDRFLPP